MRCLKRKYENEERRENKNRNRKKSRSSRKKILRHRFQILTEKKNDSSRMTSFCFVWAFFHSTLSVMSKVVVGQVGGFLVFGRGKKLGTRNFLKRFGFAGKEIKTKLSRKKTNKTGEQICCERTPWLSQCRSDKRSTSYKAFVPLSSNRARTMFRPKKQNQKLVFSFSKVRKKKQKPHRWSELEETESRIHSV